MFFEADLDWEVVVHEENVVDTNSVTGSLILEHLLMQLSYLKASENGYYIALTQLNSISEGSQHFWSEKVIFPVNFRCRFFKPVAGETMTGIVRIVTPRGVYIKSGPMKRVFLSAECMRSYNYVSGENQAFVREDGSKIETGVPIQYVVSYANWMGHNWREFQVLASLNGDGLGPVSFNGEDGIDF